MRKRTATLFFLLLFPTLALAGHDKKSCDAPVQDCLDKMVTKLKSTGFIGVEIDEDKASKAYVITKVVPGSPAEEAGIQKGDELYALNGITFAKENYEKMGKIKKPGQEVMCTIKRNGQAKELKLTLVPMPADTMAKYIGDHMMLHVKKDQPVTTAKR